MTADTQPGTSIPLDRRMMAFLGGALLLLGAFLPVVSAPIIGGVSYFSNGKGDGEIVVLLALAIFVLASLHRFRFVLYAGSAAAALILAALGYLAYVLQGLQHAVAGLESQGLAGALGSTLMNSIQLQWGWAVLILGAFLVICAGVSGVLAADVTPSNAGGATKTGRMVFIQAAAIGIVVAALTVLGHTRMGSAIGKDSAQPTSATTQDSGPSDSLSRRRIDGDIFPKVWTVSVDTNAMDGTMKTVITVYADGPTTSTYGVDRPASLLIRCDGGTLAAFINTPSQLQSNYETHEVAVRLRFDAGAPESANWDESESGDAMFAPHPRSFVSRLLKTQLLLVEYPPFQRTPTTIKFTTAGLGEKMQQMSACPLS